MNLLILEDDRDLHPYYKSVCKGSEHVKKCITVANSYDFREALERNAISLIISDLHMVPIRGDLILLDNKSYIFDIPIVLLSYVDNVREIADDLIDRGLNVVECLQKPLIPDAFYELIG